MFHDCEGQSHKTMSTDNTFWREWRAESDLNRSPSAYQPNALPTGQTGWHNHGSVDLDHSGCGFCIHPTLWASLSSTLLHTPSTAFWHPPPMKDVINQCLEFASTLESFQRSCLLKSVPSCHQALGYILAHKYESEVDKSWTEKPQTDVPAWRGC